MAGEIRYGIIGAGSMGREHIQNVSVMDGGIVTALADPHQPSLDAALTLAPGAKTFSDHRGLLESGLVDAVVIATPNDTHVKVLKDVLATEIPTLIEKPLATTVEDCTSILDWSKNRKALTWMALEYRFMPPVTEVIQRAAAGEAGKIHQITIREHREPFYPKIDNWNRFTSRTGGTLVEKCCHYFNLMDIILEEHPVKVYASGSQAVNHLDEKYNGVQADMLDNAYVVLEYDSGARAMLELCMFAEGTFDKEILTVVGSEGKIESFLPSQTVKASRRESYGARNAWSSGASQGRGQEVKHVHNYDVRYMGHHFGASYIEHIKFRDALNNGTPAEVTLEDGVTSVITGLAAHKSIREGRPVTIAEMFN